MRKTLQSIRFTSSSSSSTKRIGLATLLPIGGIGGFSAFLLASDETIEELFKDTGFLKEIQEFRNQSKEWIATQSKASIAYTKEITQFNDLLKSIDDTKASISQTFTDSKDSLAKSVSESIDSVTTSVTTSVQGIRNDITYQVKESVHSLELKRDESLNWFQENLKTRLPLVYEFLYPSNVGLSESKSESDSDKTFNDLPTTDSPSITDSPSVTTNDEKENVVLVNLDIKETIPTKELQEFDLKEEQEKLENMNVSVESCSEPTPILFKESVPESIPEPTSETEEKENQDKGKALTSAIMDSTDSVETSVLLEDPMDFLISEISNQSEVSDVPAQVLPLESIEHVLPQVEPMEQVPESQVLPLVEQAPEHVKEQAPEQVQKQVAEQGIIKETDIPMILPTETETISSNQEPITFIRIEHAMHDVALLLGDLMSQETKLDSVFVSKLHQTRTELNSLALLLAQLEQERAQQLSKALELQGEEFSQILKEQLDLTYESLVIQAKNLEHEYHTQLKQSLESVQRQHEVDILEKLNHQKEELTLASQTQLLETLEKVNADWNRIVKEKVDEEREGRLSKLDLLIYKSKLMEKVVENSQIRLDSSLRLHKLASALDILNRKINSSTHPTFVEEYKQVEKLITDSDSFKFLESVLKTIPESVLDQGMESFAELEAELQSLLPLVRSIQLTPVDAGPISHLLSPFFSLFILKKNGFVPGKDVESVLSRVEYYLESKDLDSAAREINQLQGWQRVIVGEWLVKARQHLEVVQALEIMNDYLRLNRLVL